MWAFANCTYEYSTISTTSSFVLLDPCSDLTVSLLSLSFGSFSISSRFFELTSVPATSSLRDFLVLHVRGEEEVREVCGMWLERGMLREADGLMIQWTL